LYIKKIDVINDFNKISISRIEEQTNTYIVYAKWSRTFKVYGLMANQVQAVEAINQNLVYRQCILHLKGNGKHPGLMKKIVQRYGISLENLCTNKF